MEQQQPHTGHTATMIRIKLYVGTEKNETVFEIESSLINISALRKEIKPNGLKCSATTHEGVG